MRTFITDPAGIENKSMLMIEEELGERINNFTPPEAAIVKRVIHTTADFEYADLLAISPVALEAVKAFLLQGGGMIVTDTNMLAVGINRALLEKFTGRVECLVGDGETRQAALDTGLTRSMINIRRAAEKYPQAVYAIGNAPTALYELLRLIEAKQANPALVIGVPVGFVEAAESKEALLESDIPHIVTRGRKGGSTVAVAMINALMKLVDEGKMI